MSFVYPCSQFVCIRNGCRKRDELNIFGSVDDRFFPNRAALGVIHIVAFVQNDGRNILQIFSLVTKDGAVQHVAKDFSRHNNDSSIAIYGDVTRQQADFVLAILGSEVMELLVGKSFQRCRVIAALVHAKRLLDCVLGNDGLSGACGSTDNYTLAFLKMLDGLELKIIELKVEQVGWAKLHLV